MPNLLLLAALQYFKVFIKCQFISPFYYSDLYHKSTKRYLSCNEVRKRDNGKSGGNKNDFIILSFLLTFSLVFEKTLLISSFCTYSLSF